jgi:hypothetical protein
MKEAIFGKKILVGLTYLNGNGEVREQVQLHGLINGTSENTLTFERSDGEGNFSIPFDGELETSDEEAIYTLRTTGEEVTGVNFIASFTIHPPEHENS